MKTTFKILAVAALLMMCGSARAQTHSVTLSWSASATANIAGYNVYRAPCNGTITAGVCSSVGTFTKITPTPIVPLNYVDLAVTAGQLLVYQVTATCPPTGCSAVPLITGESVPSNQVAVTIPNPANPPLPPANLTGVAQ